jgi:hypothetical protein
MALLTKGVAAQIATSYNQALWDRALQQLGAVAQTGALGTVVPYGNSGAGAVTAAVTVLQNLGWTVVQDDIGKTLTIS